MEREDLFKMLDGIRHFPVMSMLVLTTAGQFTAERSGKLVRATKDGAILLTPRGAMLVRTLKAGREWLPLWRGERELSEAELTASEGEIVAAINAMKG